MVDPASSRSKESIAPDQGAPQRLTALAGDVIRDTKAVFRAELDLARAELKQDVKALVQVAAAATAGIILLHVSLLALATAVVLWFDGSVWALFGVGMVLLAAGAAALYIADKQR